MGGIEGTIHLRDGRTLAYSEWGATSGTPVFYFHGWPGSRKEGWILHEAARRRNLRLITTDRPGYGRSTFKPGRRILDWPDDIAQLAEALRIDRFYVIGYSGGGPYAAACCRAFASRIDGAAIVGGVAPQVGKGTRWWRRIGVAVVRRSMPLVRFNLRLVARGIRRAPRFTLRLTTLRWSKRDREILRQPGVRERFTEELRESFRQGIDGPAQDFRLYLEEWGFTLDEVPVRVHLWYGDRDRIIPQRQGKQWAAGLPASTPHWIEGEGHALIIERAEDIVSALVAAPPA